MSSARKTGTTEDVEDIATQAKRLVKDVARAEQIETANELASLIKPLHPNAKTFNYSVQNVGYSAYVEVTSPESPKAKGKALTTSEVDVAVRLFLATIDVTSKFTADLKKNQGMFQSAAAPAAKPASKHGPAAKHGPAPKSPTAKK